MIYAVGLVAGFVVGLGLNVTVAVLGAITSGLSKE